MSENLKPDNNEVSSSTENSGSKHSSPSNSSHQQNQQTGTGSHSNHTQSPYTSAHFTENSYWQTHNADLSKVYANPSGTGTASVQDSHYQVPAPSSYNTYYSHTADPAEANNNYYNYNNYSSTVPYSEGSYASTDYNNYYYNSGDYYNQSYQQTSPNYYTDPNASQWYNNSADSNQYANSYWQQYAAQNSGTPQQYYNNYVDNAYTDTADTSVNYDQQPVSDPIYTSQPETYTVPAQTYETTVEDPAAQGYDLSFYKNFPLSDSNIKPSQRATYKYSQAIDAAYAKDTTGKAVPFQGWRKGLYNLSGRKINLGPSSKEKYRATLAETITKPLHANYQITVLSMKGGVGKTTTTFILGSILGLLRDDKIVAIDANPDLGTLGHKAQLKTDSTIRDLIEDDNINDYSDIVPYVNTAKTGLDIIVSSDDINSEKDGLSLEDYRDVMTKLGDHYRIALTDCGTGLNHPAVSGALEAAHVVVIPTIPSIDCARSTLSTIKWLENNGYEPLLKNSIIVINSVRHASPNIDVEQMKEEFLPHVRAIISIPYDPHVSDGGYLDLDLLRDESLKAYTELAALIVENFS